MGFRSKVRVWARMWVQTWFKAKKQGLGQDLRLKVGLEFRIRFWIAKPPFEQSSRDPPIISCQNVVSTTSFEKA